ncbi:hypothetical protein Q0M94_28625 (plasmid) [Deinococcus radiomollis]|uniref:hypothetical protein n=1 Tax=Deinococcus radiomollis TaxID=468916 RepID=UPI0038926A5F
MSTRVIGLPLLTGTPGVKLLIEYDSPWQGGTVGLAAKAYRATWDYTTSKWLDASGVELTIPLPRVASNDPGLKGALRASITATYTGLPPKTALLALAGYETSAGVYDLTIDPAPIQWTTAASLAQLITDTTNAKAGALAAQGSANTAATSANTAAGTAVSAAGTATTAAAAADTARTSLTTQVTSALATNTATISAGLAANTSTLNASIASQNSTISSGLALALTASNIQRYATAAERNAAAPADGTWAFTTSTGEYHRREAGAWVLRGSATTFVSGTRAQRQAFTPSVLTDYRETDTHVTLTYYPGTGWRDVYGNNPDAAAPPLDTGVY